jgi:predicted glycosyltransferase
MIIWFDAVTAKDPLLFHSIAKELEKLGHDVIFTCREYDYVSSLFDLLERDVKILGKHGGGTLFGKLLAGNERIKLLAEYVHNLEKKPDIHISFACPESTRVAFGLGIPVINVNDSPHAKAVGKLTIPLTKFLVYSSSIGKENWLELGALDSQLFPYDGIDEVAWLIDFSPKEETLDVLGLNKNDRFIVARPEESSAAYMLERKMQDQTLLDEILDNIFVDYEGKAVVFPRYERQKEVLLNKFGDRIIIPPKAVDTLSLYYFSDLCITGGATMAREAAALGTPSISYYPKPLEVLEYITSIGIPLFNEYNLQEAISRAKDLLENPVNKSIVRNQVKNILEKLESPTDKIKEILAQL